MRDQFDGDDVILENALPFLVHGLAQLIRSRSYKEFNQHGLEITPEQWIVLVRLWQKDGRTVSELSESTLRDRPTMSRILDTMEASGLLRREQAPNDARSRFVQLTREGRTLRKKLVPIAKGLVAELERGIPEEDLKLTRETLRRMLRNLL
jgi:MarR family transcriptional regulator, organic hydroperoxide resistance regulator